MSIYLNIISENNKTIDIIDISNSSFSQTINNSEPTLLSYSNFNIDIKTSLSSINMNSFFDVLDSVKGDYLLLIIFMCIIVSFIAFFNFMTRGKS